MDSKEFFDRDFYLFMLKDYEDIRQRSNQRRGRPSEEDMIIIAVEKQFERFYKKFL